MTDLAIIIPAYKIDFFERTLQSLANQTCKDFTVYVGEDCSPADFKGLIDQYQDQLDIHYIKFETNMGGKDLVAQWERCVDLSQGEPWLWLFSDDDELEPTCVECFYKTITDNPGTSLVHFDVKVIDERGDQVMDKQFVKEDFAEHYTSKEYAKARLQYKINSFVVEYVFRKETFMNCGRFQNFDMAWGSDDATWIKLSKENGITTTKGARVRWRLSSANITPRRNPETMRRKLNSVINYINFLDGQFDDRSLETLYYWYYIHALYNAMKECAWSDIKNAVLTYKENRKDYVPVWSWGMIHKLIYKNK